MAGLKRSEDTAEVLQSGASLVARLPLAERFFNSLLTQVEFGIRVAVSGVDKLKEVVKRVPFIDPWAFQVD